MTDLTPAQVERFWLNVDKDSPDNCWTWSRSLDRQGYGKFFATIDGRKRSLLAHRVAFVLFGGVLDQTLVIDHLCRTRTCCNPAHMDQVTTGENIRRGLAGRYPHRQLDADGVPLCKAGHRIEDDNKTRCGESRVECRICKATRMARWRQHRSTGRAG